MFTVILVIHLLIAIALVGTVLLQRSEGGGLGMGSSGGGGGMGGFMSGRAAANLLTRTTAGLAAAFFITSMTLAFMSGIDREQKSILDTPAPVQQQPAEPAEPAKPSVPLNQ
ncbi:MAG: preprotein translocase subunit SecG [Rhodospirillales bacterium]|nr:preprotein translocase subunit SecG [Rhodospirillales bacterium]